MAALDITLTSTWEQARNSVLSRNCARYRVIPRRRCTSREISRTFPNGYIHTVRIKNRSVQTAFCQKRNGDFKTQKSPFIRSFPVGRCHSDARPSSRAPMLTPVAAAQLCPHQAATWRTTWQYMLPRKVRSHGCHGWFPEQLRISVECQNCRGTPDKL